MRPLYLLITTAILSSGCTITERGKPDAGATQRDANTDDPDDDDDDTDEGDDTPSGDDGGKPGKDASIDASLPRDAGDAGDAGDDPGPTGTRLFPKNQAAEVNPDTRLRITFPSAPPLGNTGKVRIYDAADDSLVDELDLSIPPGPRNTRTPAPYDTLKYASIPDTVYTVNAPDTDPSHVYQANYVGGTAENNLRRFFPVLIDGAVATIHPHNNKLTYGKTYYVQVDAAVFPFTDDSFAGVAGKTAWRFTTKKAPPAADAVKLVVAADGSADFSTVQGAVDFIPAQNPTRREIFVENGVYDEMVVLDKKQNITIRGESRAETIVRYATNGVFNRVRYEFALASSNDINLINFTIQSVGKDENPAQAEALYVRGDKIQVHDVAMLGSGDALQIQAGARIYLSRSTVRGYGDNILSYGAAFFRECEMVSTYGPHGWPRNPNTNHGDVFLDSTFRLEGPGTKGDGHCDLARSPTTGGTNFPYAEFVVLNSKLQGIADEGWGAVGPDASNVHFWEYNSVNLSDGKPVDVSKRAAHSRQLTMDKDAETIANYSNPTYVLGGWTPELAPAILKQPAAALRVAPGGTIDLSVEVAALPAATYQWLKDGQPLAGATAAKLTLTAAKAANSGTYTVRIRNAGGSVDSEAALVRVE